MFIDLHSHLDLFKDIPVTIENARKNGLKIVVSSGIHPESNRIALSLAEKYDIVKASLGLYPIDALEREMDEYDGRKYSVDIDKELDFIRENHEKFIAVGEIGLDYKNGKDKEAQKKLFRQLLELAVQLHKPVIIHSRKAERDVLDMLEEYKDLKVILHCFSGKKNLVVRAKENGYFFTIPTNVVRSEQFQYMIRNIPLGQLFCETDAPFLSPFREQRNEPAFVVESYKKIAELKKMDIKEVGNIIYINWQRVFL